MVLLIKEEKGMNVPVKLFLDKTMEPDKNTVECLKRMAMTKGIYKHIAALPDLHYKHSRAIPTGVAVATRNLIIPKFVLSSCGMSMIKTGLSEKDINEKKLDEFFNKIKSRVNMEKNHGFIDDNDFKEIISKGAEWADRKFGIGENDNIEHNGNMFGKKGVDADELMQLIPKNTRKLGLIGMGVFGGGNHFIELQKVEKIIDKAAAKQFGIKEGQIMIMLHTGSEIFGKSMHEHYTGRSGKYWYREIYQRIYYLWLGNNILKRIVKKLNQGINVVYRHLEWKSSSKRIAKREFGVIQVNSAAGEKFIKSKFLEANYAYANRAVVRKQIYDSFKEVFGDKEIILMWDNDHEAFQKEKIGKEELWVHRHGASRAMPKEYFKGHKIFGKTGQMLFVPGSMGAPTYIGRVKSGCKDSFYSANHGAGRLIDRPEARLKFKNKSVLKEMEKRKVRLYRYKGGSIVEESPESYKNVDAIMGLMEKEGLGKAVARLVPIAVLKGD